MAENRITEGPTGIGGWLALFLFTCFVGPIGTTLNFIDSLIPETRDDWDYVAQFVTWIRAYVITETVVLAIIGLAFLSLGFVLLRKRPYAPLYAVILLLIGVLYNLSDLLVTTVYQRQVRAALGAIGETLDADAFTDTYAGIGRSVVWLLIWLSYFFTSRRVRNTYGEVSWERIVQWLSGRLEPERPTIAL